ncbi:hypothetical protein [Rubellimicrobium rubrum]|nr:hypothetical protein [Rubellimicrobium rubrum]
MPTAEPRADLVDHLSNVALEREVKVVVPNHLYQSEVQRFGFCYERVTG